MNSSSLMVSDVVGPVGHRAPKVPEGLVQAGLRFGGQVVRADIAERGDGFADLLHVPRATGAQVEMRFEGGGGVGVQVAFEVVGDQFDDLAAAERMHGGHRSLPSSVAAIGMHSARWLPCWTVVVVSLANGCDVTRSRRHPAG